MRPAPQAHHRRAKGPRFPLATVETAASALRLERGASPFPDAVLQRDSTVAWRRSPLLLTERKRRRREAYKRVVRNGADKHRAGAPVGDGKCFSCLVPELHYPGRGQACSAPTAPARC